MRYQFGDITFDVARQELRRGDALLHATPKAMQLLEMLIVRRGEVARREDLVDTLWPDVVVSEASLKNLVALLRSVLGDHGRDGALIQTVHNRGYRFTENVIELGNPRYSSGHAKLWLGEQWFSIVQGPNLVGREPDCEIIIDHASISRHHARITMLPDRMLIEDLESKNGTFIRGERISGVVPLEGATSITFGRIMTKLVVEGASPSTESVSSPA